MVKVTVIGQTLGAEYLIERAGKTCYASSPGDAGRFVRKLIKSGHESVLEHASITFKIEGISRACSHQLVRHRIASYSQESQRYVEVRNMECVIPPEIAENPEALEAFTRGMEYAKLIYGDLRRLGIRKEDARFVLPNAAATKIVVTMNFRSLRHFFEVRCDKAAQWEIRQLALEMLRQSVRVCSPAFTDLWEKYNDETQAPGRDS